MSAPNAPDDEQLIPELGDIITVISSVFGKVSGSITYRDEGLIRIVPTEADIPILNLPMNEDGDFADETGITELVIHTKRATPYFCLQLGCAVGESLEFLAANMTPIMPPGIVAEIQDGENDAVVLTDGRRLDFAFIGPPAPVIVINVRASEPDAAAAAAAAMGAVHAEGAPEDVPPPDNYDLSLLAHLLPARMIEEVPTAERTYSETIQREDMYKSLLELENEKYHNNPAVLRKLARETDLLLALKNAVSMPGTDGVPKPFIKSAETLRDILTRVGAPLSSIIPVLALKRIVYCDKDTEDEPVEEMLQQVDFRNWLVSEVTAYQTSASYLAGQSGGAAQISKLMYTYLYDVLYREGAVFQMGPTGKPEDEILVDQEVLRTVLPPEPVMGFSQLATGAEVTVANVGKIMPRMHRVISGTRTEDDDVIAPGDPATAVNYIVMPVSIGSVWRPVKFAGALSEDINAAAITQQLLPFENITNTAKNYNEDILQVVQGVPTDDTDDASAVKVADWISTNLDKHVHPFDILSSSAVGVNRVIDSIGLRSYEWTPEIATAIWQAVAKAQATFISAFDAYKAEVAAAAKDKAPFSPAPGIPEDSPLYTKVATVKVIGEALAAFEKLDPVKGKWDLGQAQYILQNAEGTLARVLYMATSDGHPELNNAIALYMSEINRTNKYLKAFHATLSQYKAEPVINTCRHVRDKDQLRSVMVRDQSKFEVLLQKFLKKYQGETNGNWIECNICNTHLICIHEVMQFYERTHPGKAQALHKEILLDFGGAAFNGKYVCRQCGIPIAEFEYDTHLEYDDNGRPLVGRAILEEDKANADDELDAILDISLNKKNITFEDPTQAELYDIARVIVQNAGFTFDEAEYRKIVDFTYNYLTTTIPPKDIYEAMRAKMKKKPMAPFEGFRASTAICITAAYIITEIHVLEPMPDVLFPFAGCVFQRGGFPIEAVEQGLGGAFEYFVCVLANLNRTTEPWAITSWAFESSPETRKSKVRDTMMKIFADSTMSVELRKAQHHYVELKRDRSGNASAGDKIPAGFRPTPNSNPPILDDIPPSFPDRIVTAAAQAPLAEVGVLIESRARQLAIEGVLTAHMNASESGIITETSPFSDSTCCFIPIQAARVTGMSKFAAEAVEQEISALVKSEHIIRNRNPVQQSNGTHLFVRWSEPTVILAKPVEPDASYFKLFMRTCFRGPREGEIHEFGRRANSYQCRYCKFECKRDPMVIMSDLNDEETFNKTSKGKQSMVIRDEAQKALEDSGATVIGDSFDTLLMEVHNKRPVDPYVEPAAIESSHIFAELSALIKVGCPLTEARLSDWALVEETMKANYERTGPPSDEQRVIAWSGFALRYESLSESMLDLLDGRQGRAPVRGVERKVKLIIDAIERLTSEPLHQGPAEIMKHWIVGLERLSKGYNEMVFGSGTWFGQTVGTKKSFKKSMFDGTKWFGKKISSKHTAKFETMIQGMLGATADTNKLLAKKPGSSEMLQNIAAWLGRIVNFWSTNIVSMPVWGLSQEELCLMLRWLVLSSMESLLLIESPLYLKIASEGEKISIQQILLTWTRVAFIDALKQYEQFGLSNDEIRLAIEDAREKEKNSVIKEIDDEKDPDLRAIALIQKGLKMGRWAIGNKKNMTTYNAEFYDFLQEQRDRIGQVERPAGAGREDPLGFDFAAADPAERWQDGHFTAEAEDEGGAE